MDGSEAFNERIQECLLWEKVKEGHIHLISTEDIEELFHAFDVWDDKLPTTELVKLCAVDGTYLTTEEVRAWIIDSDTDGTGEASVADVHRGITQGTASFSLVKRAMFGEEKECKSPRYSLRGLLVYLHTAPWGFGHLGLGIP